MGSDTLERQAENATLETELGRLGRLIEEHFPAEAAEVDMSDPKDVVALARQLLKRLWRWEN